MTMKVLGGLMFQLVLRVLELARRGRGGLSDLAQSSVGHIVDKSTHQ